MPCGGVLNTASKCCSPSPIAWPRALHYDLAESDPIRSGKVLPVFADSASRPCLSRLGGKVRVPKISLLLQVPLLILLEISILY